jgi:hypothetical protein
MTVRMMRTIGVDDDLERLSRFHRCTWCNDLKFDFAADRPYDRNAA